MYSPNNIIARNTCSLACMQTHNTTEFRNLWSAIYVGARERTERRDRQSSGRTEKPKFTDEEQQRHCTRITGG